MITPNPSRSVSPEPTKGEEARTKLLNELALMVDGQSTQHISLGDRYAIAEEILNREDAIRAAYIPLVEAAEAAFEGEMCVNCGGENVVDCTDRHCAFGPVRIALADLRALVQVPGALPQNA